MSGLHPVTPATHITDVVSIALGLEELWEVGIQSVLVLHVFSFRFV